MPGFRKNVCVVVRNTRSGLLLMCHRNGFPRDSGWQFPQGGLHKGEDLISEMRRELREEIGTDNVKILARAPKKYTYFFPQGKKHKHGDYSGQTQQWVLVEFSGDDGEINFNGKPAEFSELRAFSIMQVKMDLHKHKTGKNGITISGSAMEIRVSNPETPPSD